jgi:hypothetical protein
MLTLSLLFLVGLATAVGTHDVQSQLERWHYDRHLATERTVFDRRGLARHQRAATFVLSPIPGWDSDDVSTAGPPTRSFRATFQSSNTYRARGNCGIPAPRQMAEPIRPLTCAIGAHQAFAPVLAQGALDAAIAYTKERKQFRRPVSDFQGVQFMLADIAVKVDAARLLVYTAAARAERGEPALNFISSAAKCFASDVAMEVTTNAVQLFGRAGYTIDFPVERMMRDAKITQIHEGTNQIQRVVMARALLA